MEYKILLGVAVLIGIVAFIYPPEEPYFEQVFGEENLHVTFSELNNTEDAVDGAVIIAEPDEEIAENDYEKQPAVAFQKYIIDTNPDLVLNITPSYDGYNHPKVEMSEKWEEYSRSEKINIVSTLGDKIIDILVEGIDKKPYSIIYMVNGSNVASYTSYYEPQGDKLVLTYNVFLN